MIKAHCHAKHVLISLYYCILWTILSAVSWLTSRYIVFVGVITSTYTIEIRLEFQGLLSVNYRSPSIEIVFPGSTKCNGLIACITLAGNWCMYEHKAILCLSLSLVDYANIQYSLCPPKTIYNTPCDESCLSPTNDRFEFVFLYENCCILIQFPLHFLARVWLTICQHWCG